MTPPVVDEKALLEIFSITVREPDGSTHIENYIPKATLHKIIGQMEGMKRINSKKFEFLATTTAWNNAIDRCIEVVKAEL